MITVIIKRHSGSITGFEAFGHAYSGEAGNDLICAAVSAILQTARLGLSEYLKISMGVSIEEGEDNEMLVVLEREIAPELREKADIILETMRLGLVSAALNGSQYLKIVETEV